MTDTLPKGFVSVIPNLSTISTITSNNIEPAIVTCVASGQPFDIMNGTYIVKSSHVAFGDSSLYGPHRCFQQNAKPKFKNGYWEGNCWASRFPSPDTYAPFNGMYKGTTTTIVSGKPVLGEYVSITAPYMFLLTKYSITSANYNGVSNPAKSWVIAGSNDDGKTYTLIDTVTNSRLNLNSGAAAPISGVYTIQNTVMYSTYIIIITNVLGGGSANLGAWNLYRQDMIIHYFKNNNGHINRTIEYTAKPKKIDGI